MMGRWCFGLINGYKHGFGLSNGLEHGFYELFCSWGSRLVGVFVKKAEICGRTDFLVSNEENVDIVI